MISLYKDFTIDDISPTDILVDPIVEELAIANIVHVYISTTGYPDFVSYRGPIKITEEERHFLTIRNGILTTAADLNYIGS